MAKRMCRWLLPLLLLFCVVSSAWGAQEVRTQRVLLIFGLNDFKAVGKFSTLEYATRDAVRLFDVLTDPKLGQFNRAFVFASREEIRSLAHEPELASSAQCLLDPTTCRAGLLVERYDPTAESVRTVLQRFRPPGNQRPTLAFHPGDMIVAYVASHGTVLGTTSPFRPVHPEQVAFITADTRVIPDSGGGKLVGHLTEQEIMQALEATGATHRLLIEATCHTDIGLRTRGSTRSPGRENVRRTLLIADASPGQSSLELDSLKATAFTDAFIEALRAPEDYALDIRSLQLYDTTPDGAITVEEAYDWAAEMTGQRTCTPSRLAEGKPCQLPSFFDRSFFRREPFILSGNLHPDPSLTTLAAATFINDHARNERGTARGSPSLDGRSLDDSPAPESPSSAQSLKPGLHRLNEKGRLGLLLWIRPGEHFGRGHFTERLNAQRSWGLGMGLRSGLGVAGSVTLEAMLSTTVLTTARGGTRLELGLQPEWSVGSACLPGAETGRDCPLNPDAASWQAGLQGFVQGQQQLPGRLPIAVLVGVSVGPTYLTVYDEAAYGGAFSKLGVVGGPMGGLEWALAQHIRWRPEGGKVQVSPPARLQLRLALQALKGSLTTEEFVSGTASWHLQGQGQLTWLQTF